MTNKINICPKDDSVYKANKMKGAQLKLLNTLLSFSVHMIQYNLLLLK